jgi:hypothetical protein
MGFAIAFACEEVESEDMGCAPYQAFMRSVAPSSDRYEAYIREDNSFMRATGLT